MVQKKVPILQTDHVKFKKLLKNLKPSSSSFQHQESSMMNKGTDMMKIMKKQRQNLCSTSFRKQISQPGKPPPPSMAATSSSSSKMKSLIKISEKKPNYMKPTTSSDARKENSQPNFKNLETSSKKNGKSPSKMVSALTKTTSFKPTRTATKKSYPFVENVQKPTCSSTLKDSKFPDFLTLNSGGTESEGTSIMKVCSYTYCSLNGLHHHHPPLPQLKSFLSARRHMMKTQRNIKMGSLSPRRSREKRDAIVEENETLQVSFVGKFLNEEYDEFFIQIYSKESEADGDRDETVKELEPSSLLLEIDHQESCNENNDTNHSDTDSADYFLEDNPIKNDASELFDPEINTMEGLENQKDEGKNTEINMEDIQGFSPFETEGHATLYLDDHNPGEIDNEYFEELKLSEVMGESIDEETITGSDTDLDHDIDIDETIELSNMQSDDEIDESDICKYDESDNTKFVKIEVDNEDVLKEDDNQELKKDCAVDDYYQPSDQESETEDDDQELKKDCAVDDDHHQPAYQKSETEDDNQELQKQNAVDDYYQPSHQKSETEDDNQELKKQNAVDDYYPPSDQKSETEDDNQELKKAGTIGDYYQLSDQKCGSEDDNQELQKQSAIGDHYQPSDRKSESQDDNQETKKDIAIEDHYQPTDQKSESDCIENLEKTDESIALCADSQSDLTKKICSAFKKTHTIDIDEDVSKNCRIGKWIYKQKESISEENDLKGFNPRGPNFLEAEPDQESEKVDLKHQMIDDRRNSEEWMLDYALRQAVNKLAVARKKKVTLLVEAFETVSPLPKWEKTQIGVGFDLQHRIQACR